MGRRRQYSIASTETLKIYFAAMEAAGLLMLGSNLMLGGYPPKKTQVKSKSNNFFTTSDAYCSSYTCVGCVGTQCKILCQFLGFSVLTVYHIPKC